MIPGEFRKATLLRLLSQGRPAPPVSAAKSERNRFPSAAIGASVAFSPRFRRAAEALQRPPFRAQRAVHICRLRLAPASGISADNGDVAEWLKAAVC